jgi:hypothetical protein
MRAHVNLLENDVLQPSIHFLLSCLVDLFHLSKKYVKELIEVLYRRIL